MHPLRRELFRDDNGGNIVIVALPIADLRSLLMPSPMALRGPLVLIHRGTDFRLGLLRDGAIVLNVIENENVGITAMLVMSIQLFSNVSTCHRDTEEREGYACLYK